NDSHWVKLSPSTSNHMATGDLDGNGKAELVVDFPGRGVWVLANNTSWSRLQAQNATNIVVGDLDGNGKDEVVIDSPHSPIMVWVNNESWRKLPVSRSRSMFIDDFDGDGVGELVVDVVGVGISKYQLDGSSSLIVPVSASHLSAGDITGDGTSE